MHKPINKIRSLLVIAVVCGLAALPLLSSAATAMDCASPTAPSRQIGEATVQSSYAAWKQAYIVDAGNGQVRVQRSASDNHDTVSEGIGYGMLFAAYNNDHATFDGLWRYEQAHLDPYGFMNWKISANNDTTGYNGATDADEDMAAALVAADTQWGGYRAAANKQIGIIKKYEVEAGSDVLKPGDVWGGSGLLNPSYLAPSYYAAFATYSGDSDWSNVQATSYKVLNAIHNNTPSRDSGLMPDWSTATGGMVNGMNYNYGYDASRVAIRLALSSSWSCDANANTLLTPFNSTNQNFDLTNLAGGYSLEGRPLYQANSTPYLAAAAAAATASTNQNYRSATWKQLVDEPASSYYPDSLRLFSLLIASGSFVSPLQLGMTSVNDSPAVTAAANSNSARAASATSSAPAPIETSSGKISVWWPVNNTSLYGSQPFKAVLDNSDVNDYTMYWQVDGGRRNLMDNDMTGYQHKQATVNVRGWDWHGDGPYKLTFTAVNASGKVLGTTSTSITINH